MIKENRLRQIADNMKVSWNRFKIVTELTEGFEDRLSYGFDLIKYHGNWENLTEESWEYLFNAKEHPLKGWSVNSRHKIISYLDVERHYRRNTDHRKIRKRTAGNYRKM